MNNLEKIVAITAFRKALTIPNLKWAKRTAVAVVGFTVLLIGIALIILPGPAIVVIPLGLAILATEFVWAKQLLQKARRASAGKSKQASLIHSEKSNASRGFPSESSMRYTIAVLSVALALILTKLLWQWIEPHPTELSLAAIAVTAWYVGLGPSLLATALAVVAVDYFFVPPVGALELNWDNAIRTAVFVTVALLISVINAKRKRALEERDELLDREREARTEAEAATRARDDFLAMVTHEMRAPLTVIVGWTKILRTDKLDEATVKNALDKIERNAKAQQQLMEDLLDISRIVAGKFHITWRPMLLRPAIEDAVDALAPAAEQKQIELSLDYDDAPTRILGDANRLRQLVWNLLANAIKFTPRKGRVSLRVTSVAGLVEITVRDNGCGISSEESPFIFERFRQGSEARRQGGLGLGLSIVRQIAEMHHGTVEAISMGSGKGATFVVKLPMKGEDRSLSVVENVRTAGETLKDNLAHLPPARVSAKLLTSNDTPCHPFEKSFHSSQ